MSPDAADSAEPGDRLTPPLQDFDELVHQRTRLHILAFLSEAQRVEFTALRDSLALTDGNLNRHLKALADAGLVGSEKRGPGRGRTWVSITTDGRTALQAQINAMQQFIDAMGGAS